MNKPLPKLNANPLALVRSLPTRQVPISLINIPEERHTDEIFMSRYGAFLRGKIAVHETRLSIEMIRRGFWQPTSGNWEIKDDSSDEENISHVIELIRLGNRPTLHIYENPNPSDPKRFICSDDVATHIAYERLGVTKAPVVLMGKPRAMEESCLSVRYYPRGKRNRIALLDGLVPVVHELVPSILGTNKPEVTQCFKLLLQAIEETKTAVKNFHKPGETTFHYHHTLYSILLRAHDSVDAIRLLIETNKPLTAAALLRSLYELALVFYVDWLSPNQTYRYLQMASVIKEKDWGMTCEEWRKKDIAAGTSPLDAKNIKDAHMRAFRLGSVVSERARIFPLGEKFHQDIYSFLSDVIHHDFSMTARYTHTLEHGDEAVYHEDVMQTLVHLADILVAAITSRIMDDIGTKAPININALETQ